MSWQKKARAAIALFVVVFIAIVVVALRSRKVTPARMPPPERKDKEAIVENTGSGRFDHYKDGRLVFAVKFGSQFSYKDGRTKFGNGVELTSTRNGKPFTVTSRDAEVLQAGDDLKRAHFTGSVKLTSEATEVTTEDATYEQDAGMLTVPGAVAFRRGRMSGTGVGATYDFNREVLWLLKAAQIKVAADDKGQGALDATSGAAGMARADHYLKLTGGGHINGEGRQIDGDEITIVLTEDDQRVQMLQLRGNSSIKGSGGTGGPQAMSAKDIDLTYAGDGRTLQHAQLMENAVAQLPGEGKSPGRRVSGKTIDIAMAPDGKTVTNLTATENVQVDLPAEGELPAKRIRSATLTAIGAPGTGLQNANFGGNVEYRETRAARGKLGPIDRTARSMTLAVKTKPGFGAVEEADFRGNVHFTDGPDVVADATHAIYHVDKDQIDLTPSDDPGPAAPRVSDRRVTVEARSIEFSLTSRRLKADTKVRSSMVPASREGTAAKDGKVPSLLKNDQPVTVTSNRLEYDGAAQHAVYSGNARLWQGDTKINGDTIVVDDKTGNLEARINAHTEMMLEDVDPKTNVKKTTRSVGDADGFTYDDAKRLATYTGHAHFVGSEGDVTAEKLELILLAGSNQLERAEGYGANGEVIVKEGGRVATGGRLTYTAKDQTYLMSGTPVKVVETTPPDCKESIGAVLTFQRAAETVDMKGNGVIRSVQRQIACPSGTR
jgi:lipopolysaccharide export system protein LptA